MISNPLIQCENSFGEKKVFSRFRGPVAKEVYRACKGICMTRSLTGPVLHGVKKICLESSNGFFYSVSKDIGQLCIGYICGVGTIQTAYYYAKNGTKAYYMAKTALNVVCLPATCASYGFSSAINLFGVGCLEEKWFGERVPIFKDDCIWVENNTTANGLLKCNNLGGV